MELDSATLCIVLLNSCAITDTVIQAPTTSCVHKNYKNSHCGRPVIGLYFFQNCTYNRNGRVALLGLSDISIPRSFYWKNSFLAILQTSSYVTSIAVCPWKILSMSINNCPLSDSGAGNHNFDVPVFPNKANGFFRFPSKVRY